MEFLDTAGVATLWGSVKNHVKSSIDAQQFKTINGTSVKGAGDIKIDLSLYKVVEVLPTSNIDTTKIYLVKDSAVDNNSYSEYMYVGGKWEKLGDFRSSVDLQPYAKTEYVNNQLATKVDKVAGKGLSTNDYTTDEKNKLKAIAAEANKYVHPTYTAHSSGLYKITVDATGHVSSVTLVTKDDITALGIPAQDTVYTLPKASDTEIGGVMIGSDYLVGRDDTAASTRALNSAYDELLSKIQTLENNYNALLVRVIALETQNSDITN